MLHEATLYRLVTKCERETMDLYRAERRDDSNSSKEAEFLFHSFLEGHAFLVYTPTMFRMFQDELIASTRWITRRVEKNGSGRKYEVRNPLSMNEGEGFLVTLDVNTNIGSCECQWYEYVGMLCSHMLAVLHRKNVL